MFMARPEVGVVWILNFPLAGKFLSKLAGVEVSTKMDVQKNDILYYYSYVKKRDLDSRPTADRQQPDSCQIASGQCKKMSIEERLVVPLEDTSAV